MNSESTYSGWRVCDPDDLVWADVGGDFVVFHRPSGKTHFLNPGSSYLLGELLEKPHTFDQIFGQFSEQDDGADEDRRAMLRDMLRHFEQLGLIEQI